MSKKGKQRQKAIEAREKRQARRVIAGICIALGILCVLLLVAAALM